MISIQAAASDRHSASKPARPAPLPPSGRLILGADQRNPLLALWLGAANIEQTKFLHWEDLELILGPGVRYPTQQREKLQAVAADPQLIQALLGQSALVGRRRGHDLYFDPHVKHDTGEQNGLKGW